ncbi:prealbumin-like fold domain-containing protein [Bifidobacterium moraviense]|nr:prealbumin-like fold domain-containing protein [Bifidobacterium sp. DSM 109958]
MASGRAATLASAVVSMVAAVAMLLCASLVVGTASAGEGATSTVTSLAARWIKTSGTIDPDTGQITFTPTSYDETLSATAQFDLTSSGQSSAGGGETIPAGDLQWRIPAHLFTGRDGKPTGSAQLPVPEAPEYNTGTGLQYTYDDATDEYVVTNAIDVPAANTFSIQVTYTATAGDVPDKDTTPDKDYAGKGTGSITSSATINGSDETKTTPPITATNDTGIIISSIFKYYDSMGETEDFLPSDWVDSGAYVDGYRYVKWKVTLSATGAQPGTAEITDTITDNLGGGVLGLLNAAGTPISNAWDTGPYTVNITPGTTYTYYVVTYYDGESLPTDESYTFENSVTGTVTGKDDGVTTEKSDTADQEIKNNSFSYDGDIYRLDKSCGDYYSNDEDFDHPTTECTITGGLTALDIGKAVHPTMFKNHYAARTYGLTTAAGSASGGESYTAPTDQSEYGQKTVRHEFIDDNFLFGEEYPRQMEQGGTEPDRQGDPTLPTQGYAKLQPDDFYIDSITIPTGCSETQSSYCDTSDVEFSESSRGWTVYDWGQDDTGNWGLAVRDPWTDYQNKDSDKLHLYGLSATWNYDTEQWATAWKPISGNLGYADGGVNEMAMANGATWQLNPFDHFIAIKAVYESKTAAAVELNLGVRITLTTSDHIKTLLKKLNGDNTAATDELRDDYVTLTDYNTLVVRTQDQIEQGKNSIAGFDWRQITGNDYGACTPYGSDDDEWRFEGYHGLFNVEPFNSDEQYYDYNTSYGRSGPPWMNTTTGAPICHARAIQRLTPFAMESIKGKTVDGDWTSDDVNGRVKIPYKVTMGETGDYGKEYMNKNWATPQQRGTFYDLLPAGVTPDVDSVKVTAVDDATAMTILSAKTYPNYRGSGRTLLRVEAKAPDGYTNLRYTNGDVGKSTMTLRFDSYISWQDANDLGYNDNAKSLHNVVAYETYNAGIADGDDNDDLTGLSNAVLGDDWSDDERAAMRKLDTMNTHFTFLYASYAITIDFNTVASSGLEKHVRGGTQIDWTNGMNNEVTVRAAGQYEYRLRYTPMTGTTAHGIVLYDSLENYLSSDTSSSATAVDENTPRWRGTLSSVNVQQAIDHGFAPKVYCSKVADLDLFGPSGSANEANRDLTDTAIWEDCTPPAVGDEADHGTYDYAKVKAVAIDLSRAADGGEAKLAGGSSVQVTLVMTAPSNPTEVAGYVDADAHAYNGTHVKTTTAGVGGSGGSGAGGAEATAVSDIDFGYTRVGLVGDAATFTFTKVDGSDSSATRPLAGATFAIYRWVGSGSAPTSGLIDPDAIASGGGASDWRRVGEAKTSGDDGSVALGGLMVGTYRLVETEAPSGFALPDCQWTITVTAPYQGSSKLVIHDPTVVRAAVAASGSASGSASAAASSTSVGTDVGATIGAESGDDARSNPAFSKASGTYVLANYPVPHVALPETGGSGVRQLLTAGGIMSVLGGVCLALLHASRARGGARAYGRRAE